MITERKTDKKDLRAIIRDMGNTIAALEDRLDSIRNNRISADATAPAIRTTSNNDDFPEICKCIYRWVQISHHQFNWKQLPKSIDERLKRLADDINPPMADENLVLRLQLRLYSSEINSNNWLFDIWIKNSLKQKSRLVVLPQPMLPEQEKWRLNTSTLVWVDDCSPADEWT